jgi:NADPH-dependent 2,4-dienoyl-CoA reductase/sulfur reductase-like enzyme
MPIKGWNLAGTYSLGGAQIALKSQACAIGRNAVFMGTGALLYLVAAQYVKAGAKVAAVVDTSPWFARVLASPKLMMRPAALWNGVLLSLVLRRAGVPVYTGAAPLAIDGEPENGVRGFSFKDKRGKNRTVECDAVAMGYHVRPETQLADLARCEFFFDERTRQWLPRVDIDGRSTVPGVYLAGDGVKVLGADAAELSGKLAALATLQDLNLARSEGEIGSLRRRLKVMKVFADGLNQAFPWPVRQVEQLSDDTVLCRCETVSVGELRRTLRETGACEANRAKAFSRVGMGRCQGRYCGNAAAEIISHTLQLPLEQAGRLRGQPPVKPMSIASAKGTQ